MVMPDDPYVYDEVQAIAQRIVMQMMLPSVMERVRHDNPKLVEKDERPCRRICWSGTADRTWGRNGVKARWTR